MAVKELIKAATISRVSDKSGKFLGFGVKSNHSEKYYQIRCVKGLHGVAYSCDCEAKEWGNAGRCNHIKAVKELIAARRQNELDGAAVVAPMVVGTEFASDLQAHLEDEMPAQPEPADQVYGALTFGTMVRTVELASLLGMSEQMVRDVLAEMTESGRIVAREMAEGMMWMDTPEQAYRAVFYGDFAA